MARRSTKSAKQEEPSSTDANQTTGGSETGATAGVAEQVQEAALEASEQVQGTVVRLGDTLREQAVSRLSDQKEKLAGGVETLSQVLRTAGSEVRREDQPTVAQYIEGAADRLETFSVSLRENEIEGLTTKVEEVARQRPTAFLAGTLGVGLLASRLFKTSSRNQAERDREREERQQKLDALLREEEALQRVAAARSKQDQQDQASDARRSGAAGDGDSTEVDGITAAYMAEENVSGTSDPASAAGLPEAPGYGDAVDQGALRAALLDPTGLGLGNADVAYELEVEVVRTTDLDRDRS